MGLIYKKSSFASTSLYIILLQNTPNGVFLMVKATIDCAFVLECILYKNVLIQNYFFGDIFL